MLIVDWSKCIHSLCSLLSPEGNNQCRLFSGVDIPVFALAVPPPHTHTQPFTHTHTHTHTHTNTQAFDHPPPPYEQALTTLVAFLHNLITLKHTEFIV